MNRHRWAQIAAAAALAGGAAWTVKFLVVAATDGDETVAASTLYVAAVLLLAVGSTWIGTKLAGERSRLLLAVLIALSPIAFWLSYMAIDGIAIAVVGGSDEGWLRDEAGILATGLAWLALGLWALRSGPPARARQAPRAA